MKNKDKQITFSDVQYPKYNTAIIVVGGVGTDKQSVIDKLSGDWAILNDETEKTIREEIRKADPEKKPNIVITDWVEDVSDFINCTFVLTHIKGYEVIDIHLVWKIEDVQVAMEQKPISEDKSMSDALIKSSYYMIDKLCNDINEGILSLDQKFDGDIWYIEDDSEILIKRSGHQLTSIKKDAPSDIADFTPKA